MITYSNSIVREDIHNIIARIDIKRFDGKCVLVTGANSMLGSYTAFTLLAMATECGVDAKTILLTRSPERTHEIYRDFSGLPGLTVIDNDVTGAFDCNGPVDYIFHFAGNASPRAISSDPADILCTNLIGTINVLNLARAKGAKVIFASTREVYGAADASRLTETTFGALDPMDDRSCYPESKRAAESLLRAWYLQYGVESVSARLAHCYGPGMKVENDGRVMADFIGAAVNGRDIIINSNGNAVRAFCYLTDATAALLLLALDGESGTAYNLSDESEPLPIRDIARIICEEKTAHDIDVIIKGQPSAPGYCAWRRVALDNSRIHALGFTPEVTLREGIRRTLRSFDDEHTTR